MTPPDVLPFAAMVISIVVTILVLRRRSRGAGLLALMTAMTGSWSALIGLELLAPTDGFRFETVRFQFVHSILLPLMWFYFVLVHTGERRKWNAVQLVTVAIIPMVTLLMLWSPAGGPLFYGDNATATTGPTGDAAGNFGPWYWVNIIHGLLLMLAGSAVLVREMRAGVDATRRHYGLLLIATWVPTFVVFLDMSGLFAVEFGNITPFTLAIGTYLTAWAVVRHRMLGTMPFALTTVFEKIADGVVVIGPEGTLVDANDAALEILGLSRAAARSRTLAQLFPDKVTLDLASDAPQRFQLRRGLHLEATITVLQGPNGEISGHVIVLRDVTAQLDAEASMIYQAMVDRDVSAAVILTDTEFRVRRWNQAAEQIYGWTSDEVLGRPVYTLFNTEYVDGSAQEALATLREDGEWRGEVIQSRKDGERIHILSSVSQMVNSAGEYVSTLAVNEDVTERKRAQAELQDTLGHLQATVNALPDLLFTLDRNGVYLEHKLDAAHPLVTELIGRSVLDVEVLPREVGERLLTLTREALDTREIRTVEYRLDVPDPDTEYEGRISPIDGHRVLLLVRNITERKQADHRLKRLNEFHQSLLELVSELLEQRISSDFYQRMLDAAIATIPGAEAGSLLIQRADGRYHFAASVGFIFEHLVSVTFTEDELLLDPRLAESRSQVFVHGNDVHDVRLDPERAGALARAAAGRSLASTLAIPVGPSGSANALLTLDNWSRTDAFSAEACRMAEFFGAELGAVLQRLHYQEASDLAVLSQGLLAHIERLLLEFDDLAEFFPTLAGLLFDAEWLEVDQISVYQIQSETSLNHLLYTRNPDDAEPVRRAVEEAGLTQLDGEIGFVGRVARQSETIHIPDTADDDDWVQLDANPLRSFLSYPLREGGKNWGVIQIGSLTPNAFTQMTRDLLGKVVSSIELAVQRQTDRERLELELAKMNALVSTTDLLRIANSRDEVYRQTVDTLLKMTNAHSCHLLLHEPTADLLEVVAGRRTDEAGDSPSIGLRLGRTLGASWRPFDQGRTVIIDHPQELSAVYALDGSPEVAGYIGTPLLDRQGRAFGVLTATVDRSTIRFGKSDKAFLEAVAQACSGALVKIDLLEESHRQALEYRELYRAADRQARELDLLQHVRVAISSVNDLETLFDVVVNRISEILGYPLLSLLMIEGDRLVLKKQVGYVTHRTDLGLDEGVTGRVARTGVPELLEDASQDPDFIPIMPDVVSEIAVPLSDSGRVVGVLNVESVGEALSERDLKMVGALADQIGVALERARLYSELRESEQRFRLLAENMSDMVCLHRPDGKVIYVSPSSHSLLGYRPDELLGLEPRNIVTDTDSIKQLGDAITQLESGATTVSLTVEVEKKSGDQIWLETIVQTVHDASGAPSHLVSASRDITERKRFEEQLTYGALYDALTGLPNRALLMDRLRHILQRSRRDRDIRFAVLFLDLDRFKVINDSLGHSVGDKLLQALAQRLTRSLRESDTVARLGGDEFAIVLEEIATVDDAEAAAQRIQDALKQPVLIDGHDVYTSASIGIALGPASYTQPLEMLRDADIAMYRAKATGTALSAVFDYSMHESAVRRQQLETDLRRAIERDELYLVYQPIFQMNPLLPSGFEALVRWHRPGLGTISPGEFIPIAEEMGLIAEIGEWVLREAAQQMVRWQERYSSARALRLNVNLSAQQFVMGDLAETISLIAAATGFDLQRLSLEITESTIMQNPDLAAAALERLRQEGVNTQIDDFGTGYSSLSYLHHFPVDFLKIDRSFVRNMTQDRKNTEIIQTILSLARSLGLQTVGEGIEIEDHLEMLREMGCDYAQGYYLSRPMTVEHAETWIAEHVQGHTIEES